MADKRAKKLVIDSNAFIKGVRLETIGEEFWTVPQVISEVRDARAREFLDTFPFKIQTRDPTPAALKAVADFSRKTGDYAFLSAVDMRVLALAYTLESETKGTAHLRTQPLKPGQEVAPSKTEENEEEDDEENEEEDEGENEEGEEEDTNDNQTNDENKETTTENNKENDHVHEHKETETKKETETEKPKPQNSNNKTDEPSKPQQDEDDGWITPANIGIMRARRGKEDDVQAEKVEVGCFTTDYAMQSVLLQMGLKLLSVDGMVIKKIRQYVLKCHACFKICKDMEKKFCPSCGNTTLLRFSVSTDDQGNLQYTQAQRLTNRGSVFAIPLPKGGKHNKDLILVEDQYLQKTRYTRDAREADVFGSDYSFAQTKTGPTQNVVIGYGKKNPNAAKRRIGKKNKPISALQ